MHGLKNGLLMIYSFFSAAILATVMFLSNPYYQTQTTEVAMLGLSLKNLTHQAELVVQGSVLGKNDSITTEFLNNSVSVGSVLKGTYVGNTINVLTRPTQFTFDGGVELTKDENVVLFLNKDKMYDGYMIVDQGKFNIDPNGVVYNIGQIYEMKNMSLPEMENNITKAG
jgi:hypothetical protein